MRLLDSVGFYIKIFSSKVRHINATEYILHYLGFRDQNLKNSTEKKNIIDTTDALQKAIYPKL